MKLFLIMIEDNGKDWRDSCKAFAIQSMMMIAHSIYLFRAFIKYNFSSSESLVIESS